jgi:hypothetical protein
MGNLVIDVWVNGERVKRYSDVGNEYVNGRLMLIESYVGRCGVDEFNGNVIGLSVWFE